MKKMCNYILFFFVLLSTPLFVLQAQEGDSNLDESFKKDIWRAEVIQVLDEQEEELVGMGVTTLVQSLQVRFIDGDYAGEVLHIDTDYIRLDAGDTIFISRIFLYDGEEYFQS